MRLILIATGDIALPTFHHLLENGPRPIALVTQPDKPVGRHQVMTPPAIKAVALAAGIPVYQPEKIGDIAAELAGHQPEVIVVMAYGQILRADILSLPSVAILNLHASLLPKYRGAACIQAAIDAGDTESGITAIHVVRELDAGDVIVAHALTLTATETGGSLHDRLAALAPTTLAAALNQLTTRTPQDAAASSYIPKLARDAGEIDWSQSATALERRIRAYDPWPGTFTVANEGGATKRLKIFPPVRLSDLSVPTGEINFTEGQFTVGCGHGALILEEVQPEGGRRMTAGNYYRGRKPTGFQPTSGNV
jgi:methionyl-tRNA formyltransferase